MKYWYLKEGDILGPWTAEEIAKDNLFTADSLVCPQDKAEQAEFWKSAQTYGQDFAAIISGDIEMEIPQEIALDDIEVDYSANENSKETIEKADNKNEEIKNETLDTPTEDFEEEDFSAILEPKQEKPAEEHVEEPVKTEEKNPFESDRPQIAPNVEETISDHTIAPRLDADGDTLLEDIPAKAILSGQEESSSEQTADFVADNSLPTEDTLEDTPILNIFEKTQQKTKELKDITENIYDTYGTDKEQREDIKIRTVDKGSDLDKQVKNNKIYLLLVVMFVLVVIALVLAFMGNGNEKAQASAAPISKPTAMARDNASVAAEEPARKPRSIAEMPPTTDTSAYSGAQASSADKQRAIAKVKRFILPNGKTLEEYLNNKYAYYQTNWVADVLSGNNYYVHFNANKIRQEPMVYSFSIDLDKNEINGLNNLGIDLLMKGE